MSTYLTLCQETAKDSGTISTIGDPATTAGQTGRLLRITGWVRDAYNDIQRLSKTWRWMEDDFSGETVASVQEYDAAALGIDRFSSWVFDQGDLGSVVSIYKTADGQTDEGFLSFMDWSVFRRTAMIGTRAAETGKPVCFTVDRANKLRLWPTPDDAYTIRGSYMKSPQVLAADADIPEMPAEFHDLIKWTALIKLAVYDEAFEQIGAWKAEEGRLLSQLRTSQLSRTQINGSIL